MFKKKTEEHKKSEIIIEIKNKSDKTFNTENIPVNLDYSKDKDKIESIMKSLGDTIYTTSKEASQVTIMFSVFSNVLKRWLILREYFPENKKMLKI